MSHLSLGSSSLDIYSSINAACLTTGPKPLPRQVLHTVRSSAFNLQYLPVALSSHSSCLLLLPRLHATSTVTSVTCLESSSYRRAAQSSWPSFVLLYIGHPSPHEIMWNANLMQLGNFIDVFLARHVSGTYAHHQEH